jgi:hypothetical protein
MAHNDQGRFGRFAVAKKLELLAVRERDRINAMRLAGPFRPSFALL